MLSVYVFKVFLYEVYGLIMLLPFFIFCIHHGPQMPLLSIVWCTPYKTSYDCSNSSKDSLFTLVCSTIHPPSWRMGTLALLSFLSFCLSITIMLILCQLAPSYQLSISSFNMRYSFMSCPYSLWNLQHFNLSVEGNFLFFYRENRINLTAWISLLILLIGAICYLWLIIMVFSLCGKG